MSTARASFGLSAPMPVTFTVDGDEYTLPELDTRLVVDTLAYEPPDCWLALIPHELADPGRMRLLRRLYDPDDGCDLDDIEPIALHVLTHVFGLDFWAAHRLAIRVHSNWLIYDAWCVAHGFDAMTSTPARVFSSAWAWLLDRCQEKKDFRQLESDIFGPPPPTMASGALRDATPIGWSEQAESDMFAAILAGA